MTLYLLGNNGSPLGQFDGYDAISLRGGEVATLTQFGLSGSDKHSKDIDDGYSAPAPNPVRPIVTTTLTGGEVGGMLYLTDDGISGYGTMFGIVVGGIVGQQVTSGALLGPATNVGSGKVTLWQNPGLYGVSLDALDVAMTTTAALVPGTALTYSSSGQITQASGGNKVGSAPNVARFIEYSSNGSLVTSNSSMTRLGVVGGVRAFKFAVIAWHPVIT